MRKLFDVHVNDKNECAVYITNVLLNGNVKTFGSGPEGSGFKDLAYALADRLNDAVKIYMEENFKNMISEIYVEKK